MQENSWEPTPGMLRVRNLSVCSGWYEEQKSKTDLSQLTTIWVQVRNSLNERPNKPWKLACTFLSKGDDTTSCQDCHLFQDAGVKYRGKRGKPHKDDYPSEAGKYKWTNVDNKNDLSILNATVSKIGLGTLNEDTGVGED